MFNKIKNQKGVALYLALVIMTIFLSMSLGLTVIMTSQRKMVRGIDYSVTALCAADTGIEYIFYLDKKCKNDAAFCAANPPPGPCDGHCTGVRQDYETNGSLGEAEYTVRLFKNCGENTAFSRGIYKEVKRALEVAYGDPRAGVRLNSSSGKTCSKICADNNCWCESVGINTGATSSDYWYVEDVGVYECKIGSADCNTEMGSYSSPSPLATSCPDEATGYPTEWTYCNCIGTSTLPWE